MLALVFIEVIVLSASRTGALGMGALAGWGLLDRRLSRRDPDPALLAARLRRMWGTSVWATTASMVFGGEARLSGSGDISYSRYKIWWNTLALIAQHPWLGVGFGEFNFAWTLTPFPGRPVAFFDHAHNLILQFGVELGMPLALLVLGLMGYALWQALSNAVADGREKTADYPVQRAAFVMVMMAAMHSLLEYPLWYSYFLLPAAFAFGLCLERPAASQAAAADAASQPVRRWCLPRCCSSSPPRSRSTTTCGSSSSSRRRPTLAARQRIADGQKSVLFAHHADYAAATVVEHPGKVMKAFERAPHFLLDARLMMAWARALEERGETDKARYVAARLKEFRNEQAEEFFAPCSPASAGSRPAGNLPFQCLAPTQALRFEDFR